MPGTVSSCLEDGYPAGFSIIQSACPVATTHTCLSGCPTFSPGCDGSRKVSGIADDEMVMGIPAKMLS